MSLEVYFRMYDGHLDPNIFYQPTWQDLLNDEDAADYVGDDACDITFCKNDCYIIEDFPDKTFWCSVKSTGGEYILISYENPSTWIHPNYQTTFATWIEKNKNMDTNSPAI